MFLLCENIAYEVPGDPFTFIFVKSGRNVMLPTDVINTKSIEGFFEIIERGLDNGICDSFHFVGIFREIFPQFFGYFIC